MLDLALKGTLSEWMNPIAKHKSSKKLWELKELGEILDKRRIYIYIYIYIYMKIIYMKITKLSLMGLLGLDRLPINQWL